MTALYAEASEEFAEGLNTMTASAAVLDTGDQEQISGEGEEAEGGEDSKAAGSELADVELTQETLHGGEVGDEEGGGRYKAVLEGLAAEGGNEQSAAGCAEEQQQQQQSPSLEWLARKVLLFQQSSGVWLTSFFVSVL
jgi:hypothetical protein